MSAVNVPVLVCLLVKGTGKTGGVQVYIKLFWHLKYLTSIQS